MPLIKGHDRGTCATHTSHRGPVWCSRQYPDGPVPLPPMQTLRRRQGTRTRESGPERHTPGRRGIVESTRPRGGWRANTHKHTTLC